VTKVRKWTTPVSARSYRHHLRRTLHLVELGAVSVKKKIEGLDVIY